MKRIDAVKQIMSNVSNEIVVASTGMIAREVCAVKDRDKNFYMMGSMGNALGIGIGIALNSKQDVIVISGDGAALMSLGTMVLHKKLGIPNLKHYVLDNNSHATTGGQPTCSDVVDFSSLAPNTEVIKVVNEKGDAPRIPLTPEQIKERFQNAISSDSV